MFARTREQVIELDFGPDTSTIDANGNYTAPATLLSPNLVTIEAAETKTSVNATSALTLWNPVPQISNISLSLVNVGPFTLTIAGSDFVNGATVSFDGSNLTTTFVLSGAIDRHWNGFSSWLSSW